LLAEELCVASLLLLRRKSGRRYASRGYRGADKRPQALTGGAGQILPRQGISSLKPMKWMGLSAHGSGSLSQEGFLKLLFLSAALTLLK
jgi:hypothetical protein